MAQQPSKSPALDTRRKAPSRGAKAAAIIDFLVEALDGDASSSLRRALILSDIAANPGTSQSEVMARLTIPKSAMIREIEWLFEHGCIQKEESANDARAHKLHVFGPAENALLAAINVANKNPKNLQTFLKEFINVIKKERPTLRDAKILAFLYDREEADKREIIAALYDGSPTTEYRALAELIEEGMVEGDGDEIST